MTRTSPAPTARPQGKTARRKRVRKPPRARALVIEVRSAAGSRKAEISLGHVGERELELAVAGARFAVTGTALRMPTAMPLSAGEQRVLYEGGFTVVDSSNASAVDLTRVEFAELRRTSYTVARAAAMLGVNASRIRQRLLAHALYGIKDGNEWRLPAFQFAGSRLVPGIEQVLVRLRREQHPVAVWRWFRTPNPDLGLDENAPLTPLEWLHGGHPPATVAELAADL